MTSELAKVGPGEVVGEMGVLQGLSRVATATAKGKCWLYGMTLPDLVDKRSDGQDHPGSVVARVLAQRLKKSMEKLEQGQKEFGLPWRVLRRRCKRPGRSSPWRGRPVKKGRVFKFRSGWVGEVGRR